MLEEYRGNGKRMINGKMWRETIVTKACLLMCIRFTILYTMRNVKSNDQLEFPFFQGLDLALKDFLYFARNDRGQEHGVCVSMARLWHRENLYRLMNTSLVDRYI